MRSTYSLLIGLLIMTIISLPLLEARGGGGRGGGRGGSGRASQRGPSMSRTNMSRSTFERQAANSARPASRDVSRDYRGQDFSRSQINDRLRNQPDNLRNYTQGQNAQNREQLNRLNQTRQLQNQDYNRLANTARDNIANRYPNRDNWFNDNFYRNHGYDRPFGYWGANPWRAATWGALAGWGAWGYSSPYYYNYGDLEDDNYVYSDQASQISTQGPTQSEQSNVSDWMTLGVFAVTSSKDKNQTPSNYIQLAIDKQGNLAGTYYNTISDKVYPLSGYVDKDTQRAAWMMSESNSSPIMETGLYNLTQSQAPVRINFADGTSQNGLLIRMEQPSKGTS